MIRTAPAALLRAVPTLVAALLLGCASSSAPPAPAPAPAPAAAVKDPTAREGWKLVWNDEFDGATLDPSKWVHEQGGLWNNAELQFYTSRPENVRLEGGFLVLEAREEEYFGNDYTSGRISTAGKASFTYGRIEARMKVPTGQGLWPAFWMLGDDFKKVAWPGCGEIDIVEVIGKEPATAHSTIHGASFHGGGGIHGSYTLPSGVLSDAEHVYAVEWEPGVLRFFLDEVNYQTLTPEDLPVPEHWLFHKPFYVILNLAVGGTWPGLPDETTKFPAQLRVDYVRVYQRAR
jgi:beta-glucanase (GH16 family)